MKLITEQNFEDVEYLVEDTKQGKQMFIEGIFIQANKQNRNGRIYEDSIIKPVVEKYLNEQVKPGRALGELGHPSTPQIGLDRVSHRITNLEWKGNDIVGKALVLNTPTGNIVKGLLEGGSKLGVSSRGMGSLEKRKDGKTYVKDDFQLSTVDVVADPSAQQAWVNGIYEGAEWIYHAVSDSWVKQEIIEDTIKALKRKKIDEDRAIKQLKDLLFNIKVN